MQVEYTIIIYLSNLIYNGLKLIFNTWIYMKTKYPYLAYRYY